MSHTPGPWRVVKVEGVGNFAAVLGPSRDRLVGTATYLNDAHLMATSPDLLKVAELVLTTDSEEGYLRLEELAVAAIAKAKGES